MDSILTSIKKLLGITEEYEHFDQDIIMHINSALMILTQLGLGKSDGFFVTDETETWNDFLNGDFISKFEGTKTYVYMKVKLIFDPPTSSAAIESMTRMVNEFEWRLNAAAESVFLNDTNTDVYFG